MGPTLWTVPMKRFPSMYVFEVELGTMLAYSARSCTHQVLNFDLELVFATLTSKSQACPPYYSAILF